MNIVWCLWSLLGSIGFRAHLGKLHDEHTCTAVHLPVYGVPRLFCAAKCSFHMLQRSLCTISGDMHQQGMIYTRRHKCSINCSFKTASSYTNLKGGSLQMSCCIIRGQFRRPDDPFLRRWITRNLVHCILRHFSTRNNYFVWRSNTSKWIGQKIIFSVEHESLV